MTYFAYLDEFGHVGPYVSRADPHHNDSPVFGLAGYVLPAVQVRGFGALQADPAGFPENFVFRQHFEAEIERISRQSGIRD